ncbi:Hpt domain-containing protein [Oceanicola sp. D3]|uniref:Hpt domain-containing protein n=1 Tax=Oceanicola sp. D3 TaxID=2587163 RepID=UPI00143D1E9D|nr:Hpt domain-containing protein [Oceanicola sp. D3]
MSSLPEHIEAFENYCALEAQAARLEVADGLARRAHRIFGVAETLSFPKLGQTALKLEVEISNDSTGTDLSHLAGELVSEMYQALNS